MVTYKLIRGDERGLYHSKTNFMLEFNVKKEKDTFFKKELKTENIWEL